MFVVAVEKTFNDLCFTVNIIIIIIIIIIVIITIAAAAL